MRYKDGNGAIKHLEMVANESRPYTGERALALALLKDGLRAFQENIDAPNSAAYLEAEGWIWGDGNTIVSFNGVCTLLGFDANYLRRKLQEWRRSVVVRTKP